jgi:hypothetical protein
VAVEVGDWVLVTGAPQPARREISTSASTRVKSRLLILDIFLPSPCLLSKSPELNSNSELLKSTDKIFYL